MAFDLSPNGESVAVITYGYEPTAPPGAYSLWLSYIDTRTGETIHSNKIQEPIISNIPSAQLHWKLKLIPGGNRIFVLAGERILVLDATTLETVRSFEHAQEQGGGLERSYVRDFSISQDGRILAVLDVRCNVCRDFYIVRVINVETPALISQWKERGAANHVAISPDGNRTIVSVDPTTLSWKFPAGSKNIAIHDSRNGKYLLGVGTSSVGWDTDFLPDNARFVTSSWGGDALKLWDADTGSLLKTLTYGPDGIRGPIALSSDGGILAIATHWEHPLIDEIPFASSYSRLLIWDIEEGELLHQTKNLTYGGCIDSATKIAISDDGSVVVVGCEVFYLFRSTSADRTAND